MNTCADCKNIVEEWNERCGKCGVHLVFEPDEKRKARYLRGPSFGALLFTQGWTMGARLYLWFLFSLIPVFGLVALFVCLFFGRRWSWKHGGWTSWEEFQSRMRLLDGIGIIWVVLLISIYLWRRYSL